MRYTDELDGERVNVKSVRGKRRMRKVEEQRSRDRQKKIKKMYKNRISNIRETKFKYANAKGISATFYAK